MEHKDSEHEKADKFVRTVTHEGGLFVYRLITGAGALYLIYIGTKILNTNEDLKATMTSFKYDTSMEIARLQGKTDVIDQRVNALSGRLTNADTRMDNINNWIMDLLRRKDEQKK